MPGRLLPLLHVASVAAWRLQSMPAIRAFSIQLHDEDPNRDNCLRFDARVGGRDVLMPDPYALGSNGYQLLRNQFLNQPLPPWRQRLPMAFWRGASTGISALTMKRLTHNLRYQLCCVSLDEPTLLDARLTAVVQTRDATAMTQIQQHLMQANLLAPRCPAWRFGLHQYLIEIDGNVNSWGLLWKLLSGSCILKVDSPRRQWYHHKLKPYVNIVPISRDLSNLVKQIHWCLAHPEQCEQIASNGRTLAEQEVKSLGRRVLEAVDALANENFLQFKQ